MVKKTLLIWGIAFIVGFYTTFVLQSLWNWFAVPALRVPPIGYWLMMGLNTFIFLMRERGEEGEKLTAKRWVITMAVLDACVPEEKQAEVQEDIKQYTTDDGVWSDVVSLVSRQLAGNTFALGIGWVIHTTLI